MPFLTCLPFCFVNGLIIFVLLVCFASCSLLLQVQLDAQLTVIRWSNVHCAAPQLISLEFQDEFLVDNPLFDYHLCSYCWMDTWTDRCVIDCCCMLRLQDNCNIKNSTDAECLRIKDSSECKNKEPCGCDWSNTLLLCS